MTSSRSEQTPSLQLFLPLREQPRRDMQRQKHRLLINGGARICESKHYQACLTQATQPTMAMREVNIAIFHQVLMALQVSLLPAVTNHQSRIHHLAPRDSRMKGNRIGSGCEGQHKAVLRMKTTAAEGHHVQPSSTVQSVGNGAFCHSRLWPNVPIATRIQSGRSRSRTGSEANTVASWDDG